jgi:hypothetical protein
VKENPHFEVERFVCQQSVFLIVFVLGVKRKAKVIYIKIVIEFS